MSRLAGWPDIDAFHPALMAGSATVGVLVALGFAVDDRRRPRPVTGRVAIAVGVGLAVAAQQGRLDAASLVAVGLVVVVVGAGWALAPDVVAGTDSPLVPVLAAISLVGVWAAVPDTEPALILGGVLVPSVVSGRCRDASRLDRLAAGAAVTAAALTGASGRTEVVGGLMCLGALVAPLPATWRRWGRWVVAAHLVIVVVASRVVTHLL